jgi:hypothetical protein
MVYGNRAARRVRPGGAYPQRSTAKSSLPGSLWWIEFATGRPPVVRLAQWDSLVRRFQQKAKNLLPYAFVFPSDGNCDGFISQATTIATGGARLRDALTVDGIWGPETSDALGALLCMYGQTTLAQRLAVNARLGITTPSTQIPLDTLVCLAFFAANVQTIRAGEAPTTIPVGLTLNAVRFPADTVLPTWSTRVRSAEGNRDWIGSLPLDGASQGEAPPANTGGTTTEAHGDEPQPSTTDTGLLNQAGVTPNGNTTTTTTTTTDTSTTTNTTSAKGSSSALLWGLAIVGVVVIGGVVWYQLANGKRVRASGTRRGRSRAQIEVTGFRSGGSRGLPARVTVR